MIMATIRFIGTYEVEIPGKGVFGPGWKGPYDKDLMKTGKFEEVKAEKSKEKPVKKENTIKDGE
jgi:hypothetical protein